MNVKISNALTVAAVVIYAAVSLLSSILMVTLQLDARAARADATAQRNLLQKQNDAIFCVLQITQEERDDASIEACKEE